MIEKKYGTRQIFMEIDDVTFVNMRHIVAFEERESWNGGDNKEKVVAVKVSTGDVYIYPGSLKDIKEHLSK